MNKGFFDSHAHLTSEMVGDDTEKYIENAMQAGVQRMINICTDKPSLEKGLLIAQKYNCVFNAAATTPHDVEKEGEELFPLMEECARNGSLVAVGETGLDYYYQHSDREAQKHFLRKYLQLAKACRLPVIIHCREAFADFFSILDQEYMEDGKHLPGVLHCFTGTKEEAQGVIKRNWYLSLSGIVTFKKSEELREVAKIVPIDQLLIETDTPYLAPQSKRGKPNQPAYLPEIAQVIAQTKQLTLEEVRDHSCKNTEKLFQLRN